MKAQWDEVGGRILLGENTGGCTEAERVPVCWFFGFKMESLVCGYVIDHISQIYNIFYLQTSSTQFISALKDALVRATEFYTVALNIFSIIITAFYP